MRKKEEELIYSLKFINAVKNGDFREDELQEIPVTPRMDEPTIYGADQTEEVYTSFCN